MQTVYAYVNEADLRRIMWAIHKVEDTVNFLKMEVPRSMAIECQQKLVAAIITQKYLGQWGSRAREYHPRYRLWKELYGRAGGMKFWILWTDLLKNIKVFKQPYAGRHWGWMAGIQAGTMDTGGKSWMGRGRKGKAKPVAWYGRILEWGGSFGEGGVHPPRPVFGPTLRDFASESVPTYSNMMAARILAQWR